MRVTGHVTRLWLAGILLASGSMGACLAAAESSLSELEASLGQAEEENAAEARRKLFQKRIRYDVFYGYDDFFGFKRDVGYVDGFQNEAAKSAEAVTPATVTTKPASGRDDDKPRDKPRQDEANAILANYSQGSESSAGSESNPGTVVNPDPVDPGEEPGDT